MKNRLRVISVLLCACCLAGSAFGQKSKKGGIAAWDKNKDGLLQDSEIPEKSRTAVKRWAGNMGLDTNKPLPIDKLVNAKSGRNKAEQKAKNEDKKNRKKNEGDDKKSKPTTSARSRRVAGFGNSEKPADTDGEKSDDKGDKEKSKSEKRAERHYSMLARSLIYQNDKNKNGRLERNEWSRLKGNPNKSDVNKDGVLTSDELAIHLRGYGSKERETTRRAPKHSNRAKKNASGKSFRFLTPQERLPEGLPGWFNDRDYNADGQITLAEYLAELSSSGLKKFDQLDLNHDGVIVAKEYLKATK